jgi:hypothetical protein
MAKTKISEYDSNASNNTDVDGVNISESCPPSGINNALREIMAHLKDFQSGTSGDTFTNAGTLTSSGTLAVTGALTLDGSAGTSGQVIVSTGSGNTPTWGSGFPSGGIIMWSGSVASIPAGWYLCDGTNGTPNLTDRMVIGAGSTYSVDGTGGSKDAIVVSHTHSGSTSSVGNHTHTMNTRWDWFDESIELQRTVFPYAGGTTSGREDTKTTNGGGSHSHTMSLNSTGSSGTNANLPPYYALAFIMKA